MNMIMVLGARPLRWLKRLLPKGQFVRSVAVLVGGTVLGQGLVILVSPILTRLYTPDDFGILAVYISCLSILGSVASLCYELAIPLPEDDKTAASLLVLSLAIVVGISCLVGLGVWLVGEQVVYLVSAPALKPYLWLLPLSFLGMGIYQALSGWAVRKGYFTRIAQTKLSQSIGKVVTQIGMGIIVPGSFGLLLGDVIGRVSGTGTLATLTWRKHSTVLRQVDVSEVRRAASRYRRFPLLSSAATLLNNLGLRLPTLLLASLYGSQVVGWLDLGDRVLIVPLALIGAAIKQVYVNETALAMRTDPERLPRIFFKVMGSMFLIAFPYIGFMAVFAPRLFPIVFGAEWAEAGVYVQFLAVMFLLQSMANPTSGTIDVLERQDLHLLREVTRIVLLSGVFVVIGVLHLEPVMGVALFGVAGSIIYMLYLGISFYAIRASMRET